MVNKDMAAATTDATPMRLGSGFSGFFRGAGAVLGGAKRLISDKKLRANAFVPILITIFAYALAFIIFYFNVDTLRDMLWQRPDDWRIYLWYAVVPVVLIFFLIILALIFVTAATTISGPFYEKMVAQLLNERGIETRSFGFIKGFCFEIIRGLFFLVPAVGLAVMGIIPYIGAPFAFVGIGIAWLGLASTAINPALISTGHGLKDQILFVFRSFSVMLGAGAVIGTSLTIPLLGLLIIPCSFVGLTELYAEAMNKKG